MILKWAARAYAFLFSNRGIPEAEGAETFSVPDEKWNNEVKIKISAGDMFTLLNMAMPELIANADGEEVIALYSSIAVQLAKQDVVQFHTKEEAEAMALEDGMKQFDPNSNGHSTNIDERLDGGYL